jgi:preprotein translocase subunit SecA
MAGRGTDIKLAKDTREQLLHHWHLRELASRSLTVDATDEQIRENVYRKIAPRHLDIPKREAEEMPIAELELRLLRHWAMKNTWESPKKIESMNAEQLRNALDATGRFLLHRMRWFETIEDMGGLHVIGTERHESRRIDNQLRGRSGRQGDKGSSRFYVSLEDDLMKMFAGDTQMKLLSKMGMKEGDAIEHPWLTKSVERAQRKVEERNFQIRKNILEYDEVMEHQRRTFYGLRQRVLEGRDTKGLIFQYITDAVTDAVALYLGAMYPAECAAEYARQILDYPLQPERLRGREISDLTKRIRQDAKDEARAMISVTIGEYMPAVDVDPTEAASVVDFDAPALCAWAKSHFGVDLDVNHVQSAGPGARRDIENTLLHAAEERIDAADLSGLEKFTEATYGASELVKWADNKLGIKMTVEEINQALESANPDAVTQQIMKHAEALYEKREIEYPVEFSMSMAMAMMRQNPLMAAEQMVSWANSRYGLGWTVETLRALPPQKAREALHEASKSFVQEGKLQKEIDAALAVQGRKEIAAYFKEKYNVTLPENVTRLEGEELRDAIRARVENVLRSELVYFERTMLLETLDPTWKDHLYAMDQLRDTINYRAFSQLDPRIEYKREGSKLFTQMMEHVRDRVTDYVFKLKLLPQAAPPRPVGPDPFYAPPSGAPARPANGARRPAAAGGGDPYYQPPTA